MRLLIFWDSITEWCFDSELWGWGNRLKIDFWKQKSDIEVANLWIGWDEIPDILKRFEIEVKAFTEKYNDKLQLFFAIWINDSVIKKNWETTYSLEEFKNNLKTLGDLAKKYTDNISFIWLTKVDEKLVSPFPWSTTWKCYKNDRIKEFDDIIKDFASKNDFGYLYLFDCLEYDDLSDGLHPNEEWHRKIYERVKEFLNKGF